MAAMAIGRVFWALGGIARVRWRARTRALSLSVLMGLIAMPAQAASIERGRALVETTNCAACHGADMNSPVSDVYPKLAGQHADYLYYAMRQYQMGNANPVSGRRDDIMLAQLQGMSEADLRDIAAYIAWLAGDLVVKK